MGSHCQCMAGLESVFCKNSVIIKSSYSKSCSLSISPDSGILSYSRTRWKKNLWPEKLVGIFTRFFSFENQCREIGRAVGGGNGLCVFRNESLKTSSSFYSQDVWIGSGLKHWSLVTSGTTVSPLILKASSFFTVRMDIFKSPRTCWGRGGLCYRGNLSGFTTMQLSSRGITPGPGVPHPLQTEVWAAEMSSVMAFVRRPSKVRT